MTFLYILLFIVFLSTLIMIHELGHLLTAKMFKVYCFEYAVGFGPKLLSFKRKNGETTFSLRAIPFGGFVSMYGEAESVPEGLEIDPNRSLLAIKKWKRAIIMVAGVTMNFILALVMFQVYEIAFPHYQPRYAHITVDESSIAKEKGLKSGDFLYAGFFNLEDGSRVFYDDSAILTYSDDTTSSVHFGFNYTGITYKDSAINKLAFAYETSAINTITSYPESLTVKAISEGSYENDKSYQLDGYVLAKEVKEKEFYLLIGDNFGEASGALLKITATNDNSTAFNNIPNGASIKVNGKIQTISYNSENVPAVIVDEFAFKYVNIAKGNLLGKKKGDAYPKHITFKTWVVDENHLSGKGEEKAIFDLNLKEESGSYILPNNLGINMQIDKNYLSYGESVKQTFVDFGQSASLIFRTIGRLFYDKTAWNEMGGIIAVGVETTRTLKNYGFGDFLRIWAMISVNLGIVNLLPFPGLDGWQLLVVAVEGIFRKEIPQKVKTWVSIIGLILLFGLMILVVVKDVIRYVI